VRETESYIPTPLRAITFCVFLSSVITPCSLHTPASDTAKTQG
jgi:hypothetical protein